MGPAWDKVGPMPTFHTCRDCGAPKPADAQCPRCKALHLNNYRWVVLAASLRLLSRGVLRLARALDDEPTIDPFAERL